MTFIAAIQVVATAKASLDATVTALAVIVVINVSLVWLPLLGLPGRARADHPLAGVVQHLAAPERPADPGRWP